MSNSQMFGLFKDGYFAINDSQNIVVPENADYKTNAIQSHIYNNINQCEIDAYFYYNNLITDCNSQRVAYMKDFLLEEKTKELFRVNEDYVIEVDYNLYNKDNKVIKSGSSSVKAKYCNAIINSSISDTNALEYHKGFVFDGRIEISIPPISRYGIKNSYVQYPYVIKFNSISIKSTIGECKYIKESDTQVFFDHNDPHFHADHVNYMIHGCNDLAHNNFASPFLTNAKIGTTIIDQMVVPAELNIPPEYTEVILCEIPCNNNEYTIKINDKLDLIIINIEVLLDNFNIVYDVADIENILLLNNTSDDNSSNIEDTNDENIDIPNNDTDTETI